MRFHYLFLTKPSFFYSLGIVQLRSFTFGLYQPLVRLVPHSGIVRTNGWYKSYHLLVRAVPDGGIYWYIYTVDKQYSTAKRNYCGLSRLDCTSGRDILGEMLSVAMLFSAGCFFSLFSFHLFQKSSSFHLLKSFLKMMPIPWVVRLVLV